MIAVISIGEFFVAVFWGVVAFIAAIDAMDTRSSTRTVVMMLFATIFALIATLTVFGFTFAWLGRI